MSALGNLGSDQDKFVSFKNKAVLRPGLQDWTCDAPKRDQKVILFEVTTNFSNKQLQLGSAKG